MLTPIESIRTAAVLTSIGVIGMTYHWLAIGHHIFKNRKRGNKKP